jgi:hypothetical protein
MVAFPLQLQMGLADSSPYFCAVTDVADLANIPLSGDSPPHRIDADSDADADTPPDPNGPTAVSDFRSPVPTTASAAIRSPGSTCTCMIASRVSKACASDTSESTACTFMTKFSGFSLPSGDRIRQEGGCLLGHATHRPSLARRYGAAAYCSASREPKASSAFCRSEPFAGVCRIRLSRSTCAFLDDFR